MKINQAFISVTYPQSNGKTDVTNRIIIRFLQARLYGVRKYWVDKIPDVLSVNRTTPRTATGETHFNLVYGSEAISPVDIGQISPRVQSYQEKEVSSRAQELDLIDEKRKSCCTDTGLSG